MTETPPPLPPGYVPPAGPVVKPTRGLFGAQAENPVPPAVITSTVGEVFSPAPEFDDWGGDVDMPVIADPADSGVAPVPAGTPTIVVRGQSMDTKHEGTVNGDALVNAGWVNAADGLWINPVAGAEISVVQQLNE